MALENFSEFKNKCCECNGCEAICPKNAIDFVQKKNSFSVPHIDENKCIECKLCDEECSINTINKNENIYLQKAYMHMNNKKEIHLSSSSGGAFQSIVTMIFGQNNKTVVYGAELFLEGQQFVCKHTRAYKLEDCKKFSGSKYIKSDLRNVFNVLNEDYLNGYQIVFSGLPCQVQAIKNFIKIKNMNLSKFFFIDLICHGVGSTQFFHDLINFIEKKYNSKVIEFKFRDKSQSWKGYPIYAKLEDGTELKNTALLRTFPILFLKGIIMRESCFNCQFSSLTRNSDITLGDFWGLEKIKKYNKKGVSLIIVNSKNAEIVINKLLNNEDSFTKEVNLCDAIRNQSNLNKGHSKPLEYETFWQDYQNLEFIKLLSKYGNYNIKGKIKVILKKVKNILQMR